MNSNTTSGYSNNNNNNNNNNDNDENNKNKNNNKNKDTIESMKTKLIYKKSHDGDDIKDSQNAPLLVMNGIAAGIETVIFVAVTIEVTTIKMKQSTATKLAGI